ncbi:MAG: 4Fe-4S cluster-binding domain-containing protein, partial [Firmicutes bacterium]|nr:4Fe-4S cluster-binding domain-containing protein [Bacillota bacterium]
MHKFIVNGRQFLFDENTNSLHEIDRLVWDLVELETFDEDEALERLGHCYPEAEIRIAVAELKELAEAGLINTDPTPRPQIPITDPPLVKALCLHLAHDCNLRCIYCFAGTGPFGGSRELMSAEVGRAALDFLVRSSGSRRNLEVDFFGGEPLLNFPVVQELVAYGRQLEQKHDKVFRFTLTSNATLLSDEVQEFLIRERIAVVLSIDGRQRINDR